MIMQEKGVSVCSWEKWKQSPATKCGTLLRECFASYFLEKMSQRTPDSFSLIGLLREKGISSKGFATQISGSRKRS